jgi:hypothetical protein
VKSFEEIGNSYSNLCDQKQSLEAKLKALAIPIKLFGENHADVANSYHFIALSYHKLAITNSYSSQIRNP